MAKVLESPDRSNRYFRGSEGDRRLRSLYVLTEPISLTGDFMLRQMQFAKENNFKVH